MILIISSAKSLNTNLDKILTDSSEYSYFPEHFEKIKNFLSSLSLTQIKNFMKISDNLSSINYQRFQNLNKNSANKFPALFLYYGDVYKYLDPYNLNKSSIDFLQTNLRIISALYGMLKPLDRISMYRLEMSTNLGDDFSKLNKYWSKLVTKKLNFELQNSASKDKCLINLASKEYSSVINRENLFFPMINIEFRQKVSGSLKNIGLQSKHARGMMVKYLAQNNITNSTDIKSFRKEGYLFDKNLSDDYNFFFIKY